MYTWHLFQLLQRQLMFGFPAVTLVKPQWGRQWSAGYFTDLGEDRSWEASIEGYYKDLENLVEYAENTLPTDNIGTNTDNNLIFGDGWSYGAEFFLKKKSRKNERMGGIYLE